MRVKILSSTSTFNGVSYNTKKTQNQKGELMKHVNFGYLNHSENVTPSELKAFLKVHSQTNSRVKDKQFHAMISCKGREYDKNELTDIAEKWLQKMGYGDNPYLIVFHSDTTNNHVHIVSSRIGTDGKKISDSMERVRAQTYINEIMGLDQKQIFKQLVDDTLKLNFSSVNQYKLYFENLGYGISAQEGKLKFFKFGLFLGELPEDRIRSKMSGYQPDQKRIKQLKGIFNKYLSIYGAIPEPVYEPLKGKRQGRQTGYRSDFSDFIKEKFNVDIIFHGKEGKAPYGYTIIDVPGRNIFKGGEVMPLKKLTDSVQHSERHPLTTIIISSTTDREAFEKQYGKDKYLFRFSRKKEYQPLATTLKSLLYDFNSIKEGERFHRIAIVNVDQEFYAYDKNRSIFIAVKKLLDDRHFDSLDAQYKSDHQAQGNGQPPPGEESSARTPSKDSQSIEDQPALQNQHPDYSFHLSISDDQDDEQVFGKNRKRNKESKRIMRR